MMNHEELHEELGSIARRCEPGQPRNLADELANIARIAAQFEHLDSQDSSFTTEHARTYHSFIRSIGELSAIVLGQRREL